LVEIWSRLSQPTRQHKLFLKTLFFTVQKNELKFKGYKTFFVTGNAGKYACVLVPNMALFPSLTFAGKARKHLLKHI